MSRFFKWTLLLLLAALSLHCSSPTGPVDPGPDKPAAPRAALTPEQTERLEEFSRELADSVAYGDGEMVNASFDYVGYVKRVLYGIELPPREEQGFTRGFIQAVRAEPGGILREAFGQDYSYLHMLELHGAPTLLFRWRPTSGGFNYHAFLFRIEADGAIRLEDFYNFASGEFTSTSSRRLVLPLLAQKNKSIFSRLAQPERQYIENIEKIQRINQLAGLEQYEEGLQLFDSLPDSLLQDKTLRVMELGLLVVHPDQGSRYIESIEKYQTDFAGDPSVPMLILDYHLVNEDYEASMAAIDVLDGMVGTDPALDFLRIAACLFTERFDESEQRSRESIEAMPEDETGYWSLVNTGLGAEKFAIVSEGLGLLESGFGYEFTAGLFADDPNYFSFVTSDEARKFFGKVTE